MTIYVDGITDWTGMTKLRHKRWSHLVSSVGEDELHAFAARLGLKRSWFQSPPRHMAHYDITPPKREKAIKLGAIAVTSRELVTLSYDNLRTRREVHRQVAIKLAVRAISPYDDGWLYECA